MRANASSCLFQSTPPVKAATISNLKKWRNEDISIHAAREGGDRSGYDTEQSISISIHAAREGGDGAGMAAHGTLSEFQSTPPVKAATNLSRLDVL